MPSTPPTNTPPAEPEATGPTPVVRTLLTGGLMGLANLVPGVSGGTMVLVMGLYDRFIDSVADVSRGRVTRSSLVFLGVLIAGAAVAFVGLSGVMTHLVTTERSLMYALFIGMTLAGAPVLWRMMRPVSAPALVAFAAGLGLMILLAYTKEEGAKEAAQAAREAGGFLPVPDYVRDVAGGALSMSAMILPGISGAYMLLLLGRYEHVTGSVSLLKDVLKGDTEHALVALQVLAPTAIGAVLSLVLLSNVLKWMLHKYPRPMAGGLLGVLIGSTAAIWPYDEASTNADYTWGAVAFAAGFAAVFAITLLAPKKPAAEPAAEPPAA